MMKRLTYKYIPTLVAAVMGLMLAGCQQAAPPAATPSSTSSSSEHSTTTNTETKQTETPPVNPDSSGATTRYPDHDDAAIDYG